MNNEQLPPRVSLTTSQKDALLLKLLHPVHLVNSEHECASGDLSDAPKPLEGLNVTLVDHLVRYSSGENIWL